MWQHNGHTSILTSSPVTSPVLCANLQVARNGKRLALGGQLGNKVTVASVGLHYGDLCLTGRI